MKVSSQRRFLSETLLTPFIDSLENLVFGVGWGFKSAVQSRMRVWPPAAEWLSLVFKKPQIIAKAPFQLQVSSLLNYI